RGRAGRARRRGRGPVRGGAPGPWPGVARGSGREGAMRDRDCGLAVRASPWLKTRPLRRRSAFDQCEIFLAGAALRADPVGRNLLPASAGGNTFLRKTGFLIIYPSTNQTHPGSHDSVARLFEKALRRQSGIL